MKKVNYVIEEDEKIIMSCKVRARKASTVAAHVSKFIAENVNDKKIAESMANDVLQALASGTESGTLYARENIVRVTNDGAAVLVVVSRDVPTCKERQAKKSAAHIRNANKPRPVSAYLRRADKLARQRAVHTSYKKCDARRLARRVERMKRTGVHLWDLPAGALALTLGSFVSACETAKRARQARIERRANGKPGRARRVALKRAYAIASYSIKNFGRCVA